MRHLACLSLALIDQVMTQVFTIFLFKIFLLGLISIQKNQSRLKECKKVEQGHLHLFKMLK